MKIKNERKKKPKYKTLNYQRETNNGKTEYNKKSQIAINLNGKANDKKNVYKKLEKHLRTCFLFMFLFHSLSFLISFSFSENRFLSSSFFYSKPNH